MISALFIQVFLVVNLFYRSKTQGQSQDLIVCRGYCCQVDYISLKQINIDHQMDYFYSIQEKSSESNTHSKICYCVVEETTAPELSKIDINLNDPKEYSIHSQNLQLPSHTDSHESLSVVDKCEECYKSYDLHSSCRIFLFSFDKLQNQWITHPSDYSRSSNIIPESGILHEIGYLICKSHLKKITNHKIQKISNQSSSISSLNRMTTQDSDYLNPQFGCYNLFNRCDRTCQLSLITNRNYFMFKLTVNYEDPYFRVIFYGYYFYSTPPTICMTFKFFFQSWYIFYEFSAIFNPNVGFIDYERLDNDIPLNKDNCYPSCILIVEQYFQNLLAYSIPIVLFFSQDSNLRFKSLSKVTFNTPVCEACDIPQNSVVKSRMTIICQIDQFCNEKGLFVSRTDIPIKIRILVDKEYPIQSYLMVHSIRLAKYDFDTLLSSEQQYIYQYWCEDYLDYSNDQKEYGVTLILQLDEIISAEVTITMWFQAADINQENSFNLYTQEKLHLNLIQFSEDMAQLGQISFLNTVALIVCSIVIGMICAQQKVLKQISIIQRKEKQDFQHQQY